MFGWIARFLFVLAGFIASWFVTRDALNFGFIQMVIATLLFTLLIFIIAFWPILKKWWQRK